MEIIVDSHQHFWDPHELDLPPQLANSAVLGRAYLPKDLDPELRRAGVCYTVLVQAFPQSLEGNRWLFRQANACDFVAGVVAWVDLQDPASVEATIRELRGERKFVGIRHIVEDEPFDDWILGELVLQSLGELARLDVPYDMLVKPRHLEYVVRVIERVPGLRMVIDHIAKPNMAGGASPGWREHMNEIAQHPQAFCKLSGLITEADWRNWRPSDLAPFVQHAVEMFGWNRVMYGSDWPVCLLAGNYERVWSAINDVLGSISDTQRSSVFGENAARFYGLRL